MQLRQSNIGKLDGGVYDTLIVGSGINGAVCAAALSGKGVKTALIDGGDFAGLTSMWTSNLIWGGIKYMESNDFKLVRELCVSRNHLIKSYPSTVQEIRFLTTTTKGYEHHPLYMYAGTWLYWFMGNCFTKVPRFLSLNKVSKDEPIINTKPATGCFEYSDAYLHDNDARFVFNFVRLSLNSGATVANYVVSTGAKRDDDGYWTVQLRDSISGREFTARTRVLINAGGPLADRYNEATNKTTEHKHVLSKGIHLIVDRLTPHKRVLAFFDDDSRLFFSIPMGNRTCIGTTDTRTEDAFEPISDGDVDFILKNINERLALDKPIDRADIISTRCGVRPLAVENQSGTDRDFLQMSRKHVIDSDIDQGHISIFGGKITDCVNVGNEVTDLVKQMNVNIPYADYRWYGEPSDTVRDEFFHQARLMDLDGYTAETSSEQLSTRLWRRYGAQAIGLLENIREDPKQAEIMIEGTEYVRCEIKQAARREMITKLEDFLRRRSKISLVCHQKTIRESAGLMEACKILFGEEDAKARFDEYFRDHPIEPVTIPKDERKEEESKPGKYVKSENEAVFESLNW